MLQIYLYGPVEQGFLDIDPDAVLQMEGLSPLFDEDLSTGEFSLPVEIRWTDKNRRLFGFGERLQNLNRSTKTFRCDVFDDGFPELVNAQITVLERSGLFSYKRGIFNATISGTQGLFGAMIKNKKLSELKLGGVIDWSDTNSDSRTFATLHMLGAYPQWEHIAFAPVAIEDFIDTGRQDYTEEFLANDTINNVVVFGNGAGDWLFGRPLSTAPNTAAASGHSEYRDYWTVPFLKLGFVIRQIFLEHGFVVTGDFLDNVDFKDLVIFNNQAVENYATSIFVDFNRTINPSNHVPDMLISDFLKAVCEFFSLYPPFINNNEVRLLYRKQVFTDKKILNINGICSDNFSSSYENVEQEQKGYKLAYGWDGADGYYGNRVRDLKDKTLVASVATFAALSALSIGRALTTNDIAYVEADNLYYVIADGTSTPLKWDVYAEKLSDYVVGEGERTLTPAVSTLCTYAVFNTGTGLTEKRNYLATKGTGSYKNFKGVQVKSEFALRLFYVQKRPFGGVLYPVSFYHNRDASNNKFLPYSLSWHGEDGLAKAFHQQWQDLRERGEIVKTSIGIDKKVLQDLQQHNILEHDNVLFLPQKIERSIPLKGEATLQMMPL